MEGLKPCYDLSDFSCDFSRKGYRLPTFTEWEYAARYMGPGRFRDKNEYSGSSVIDEVAWYKDNAREAPNASEYDGTLTHPVGTKKPNELGIYDISGNVNEWVWDWYTGSYKPSGLDPRGPDSGTYKFIRGGSWTNRGYMCRVGRYTNAKPGTWCGASSCDLGFRIVRTE
jgi:formylglycine-generating enzyme required for sulfatase activity